MPARTPALLTLLRRVYANGNARRVREKMLQVKLRRKTLVLPEEFTRYWHAAFSAALNTTRKRDYVPTVQLAAELGDRLAQADALNDERMRNPEFLKAFVLRVACMADRLGVLHDDRLLALVEKCGCLDDSHALSLLTTMTSAQIRESLEKGEFRSLSLNTPVGKLRELTSMMTKLERQHAEKVRPIINKLESILFDAYDNVHRKYTKGNATGKVHYKYESLLDKGSDAIQNVLQQTAPSSMNSHIRTLQDIAAHISAVDQFGGTLQAIYSAIRAYRKSTGQSFHLFTGPHYLGLTNNGINVPKKIYGNTGITSRPIVTKKNTK